MFHKAILFPFFLLLSSLPYIFVLVYHFHRSLRVSHNSARSYLAALSSSCVSQRKRHIACRATEKGLHVSKTRLSSNYQVCSVNCYVFMRDSVWMCVCVCVCVCLCVCVCVYVCVWCVHVFTSQFEPSAIPQHCAEEECPGELNTVIKQEPSTTGIS